MGSWFMTKPLTIPYLCNSCPDWLNGSSWVWNITIIGIINEHIVIIVNLCTLVWVTGEDYFAIAPTTVFLNNASSSWNQISWEKSNCLGLWSKRIHMDESVSPFSFLSNPGSQIKKNESIPHSVSKNVSFSEALPF